MVAEWQRCMNVAVDQLLDWLVTPESSSVGTPSDVPGRSVGQLSGEANARLLETPAEAWTDTDWKQAARTLGYVRRHRAQFPAGDVTDSRWRKSLRNWGHDPLWAGRLECPATSGALTLDGAPCGRLVWHQAEDVLVLETLEIDEELRRRGLGTAALHHLGRVARGRPIEATVAADGAAHRYLAGRRFGVLMAPGPDVVMVRA